MRLHVLNNQRPEVCTPCGGKCCHNAPGAYFPGDFGETDAEIRAGVSAALLAGSTVLSDYDEEPYVHAPIRGRSGIVQEGSTADRHSAACLSQTLRARCAASLPCSTSSGESMPLDHETRTALVFLALLIVAVVCAAILS